ncbi:MAG TPA: hypothetical protein VFF73_26830 [Planctomycetota bacterium]|nr:hypothetical protein [Planctomycetota bacterium]
MKRKLLSRSDLTVSARRSPNSRCAYCHGASTGLEECLGCGVLTHRDCRSVHGSCPTLGCSFEGHDASAGRWNLLLRILARGLGFALAPGIFVLPAIPFVTLVPLRDLVVAGILWAIFAVPVLARAVHLARRSWSLLEETPEPLLMSVTSGGDEECTNRVATFTSPSDPTGRAQVTLGMLHAPDWALATQVETPVLVHGARGTGPFVVVDPGSTSPALLAPILGVRMPVPPSERALARAPEPRAIGAPPVAGLDAVTREERLEVLASALFLGVGATIAVSTGIGCKLAVAGYPRLGRDPALVGACMIGWLGVLGGLALGIIALRGLIRAVANLGEERRRVALSNPVRMTLTPRPDADLEPPRFLAKLEQRGSSRSSSVVGTMISGSTPTTPSIVTVWGREGRHKVIELPCGSVALVS